MRRLSEIVRDQHPVTLPPGTTVQAACERMHEERFASVLVTDASSALLGIFTRADVVRTLAECRDPATTVLAEVMTPAPTTMSPEASVLDALRVMWDGGFHHMPLTRAGRVVGVVSHSDFRAEEFDHLEHERHIWEHMR